MALQSLCRAALQSLAADKWTLMGRAVRGVAMVACHWDLYYIAKKRTEKVSKERRKK